MMGALDPAGWLRVSVVVGDDFYETLNQPGGDANPQDGGSSDKCTQLGCHCAGGDVDVC